MALGLTSFRLWAGGTTLACLAIAAAYLPPRGRSPERAPRFASPPAPQGATRVRAGALAAEWRAADRAARLAEFRETLRPQITDLRRQGAPGPAVLFDGPLPAPARAIITAQLDTVWRALQLGAPKVSMGVVFRVPDAAGSANRREPPRQASRSAAFLLPDSTDRSTCVVLLPLDYWAQHPDQIIANARLDAWVRSGLGPCAYYAALGAPGGSMGRWLYARRFDLLLGVGWDRSAANRTAGWFGPTERRNPWFWRALYGLPVDAVACLGARVDGCRRAVLAGSDGTAPATGELDTFQWWRRQSLFGGEWYFSDLLRGFGRERVGRFWSTDLPIDSAFVEAMGTDIGAWTRRWQREQTAPVTLGPLPPAGATVMGLVMALGAVGVSAGLATRRRVA
jgi:hypothetical protein